MLPAAFAADLGGTKLAAALVSRQGKFLARKTEAVDLSSSRAPVAQICRLARELAGKNKTGGRRHRCAWSGPAQWHGMGTQPSRLG